MTKYDIFFKLDEESSILRKIELLFYEFEKLKLPISFFILFLKF